MKIAIIGAGPCGLGAAMRLNKEGFTDWELFESSDKAGGLSTSYQDESGFTWDIGGHVLFSKYNLFRNIVTDALKNEYYSHIRSAWIKTDKWVPYPYQENLYALSEDNRRECIQGLESRMQTEPNNFYEWILSAFGKGISNQFMLPYNYKVWGTELNEMDFHWIAERVKVISQEEIEVLKRATSPRSEWGPNSKFIFPKQGGTGAIFKNIAKKFTNHLHYNHKAVKIDLKDRIIHFADNSSEKYDWLISSMRLDHLLDIANAKYSPKRLRTVGGAVVGIGVEAPEKSEKCWVYFPSIPPIFYRLTYFHHYSKENVPGGDVDRYASYMCETILPDTNNDSNDKIINDVVSGLRSAGILTEYEISRIVTKWLIKVPAIYPVPMLGLREELSNINPILEAKNILSRGRFGGWKYEVGNMDHSFMQGWEAAGRILFKEEEKVYNGK